MGYIPDEVVCSPLFEVLSGPNTELGTLSAFINMIENRIAAINAHAQTHAQAYPSAAVHDGGGRRSPTLSSSMTATHAAPQSQGPAPLRGRTGSVGNILLGNTYNPNNSYSNSHSHSNASQSQSQTQSQAQLSQAQIHTDDELNWHVNLTLYKSPDYNFAEGEDWDPSSLGSGGPVDGHNAEWDHGTGIEAEENPDVGQPNRRRLSFQAQRDSLYSLHVYPVRRRAWVRTHNTNVEASSATSTPFSCDEVEGAPGTAETPVKGTSMEAEESDEGDELLKLAHANSQLNAHSTVAAGSSPPFFASRLMSSLLSPISPHTPTQASVQARTPTNTSDRLSNGQIVTAQVHTSGANSGPGSAYVPMPVVLVAIIFSEIKPVQIRRADMLSQASGHVRSSLRIALGAVAEKVRTSFNSTSSNNVGNLHPLLNTVANTSTTAATTAAANNNSSTPTHRRSFQMKPRGSFSSFRSDKGIYGVSTLPGSESNTEVLANILGADALDAPRPSSISSFASPVGSRIHSQSSQQGFTLSNRPSSAQYSVNGSTQLPSSQPSSRPTSVSEYKYEDFDNVMLSAHEAVPQNTSYVGELNPGPLSLPNSNIAQNMLQFGPEVYSPMSTTPQGDSSKGDASTTSRTPLRDSSRGDSGRDSRSNSELSESHVSNGAGLSPLVPTVNTRRPNSGRHSLTHQQSPSVVLSAVAEDTEEDRDSLRSSIVSALRPSVDVRNMSPDIDTDGSRASFGVTRVL
jgi:hypothetical protein